MAAEAAKSEADLMKSSGAIMKKMEAEGKINSEEYQLGKTKVSHQLSNIH